MADDGKGYWFRAKRYGWGWGAPCAWQGWVILALFLVLPGWPVVLSAVLDESQVVALSLGTTVIGALVLVVACVRKGEPTRWRWGRDS